MWLWFYIRSLPPPLIRISSSGGFSVNSTNAPLLPPPYSRTTREQLRAAPYLPPLPVRRARAAHTVPPRAGEQTPFGAYFLGPIPPVPAVFASCHRVTTCCDVCTAGRAFLRARLACARTCARATHACRAGARAPRHARTRGRTRFGALRAWRHALHARALVLR